MKNIFIGISMLVLAFYLLFQQTQQQQELSEKIAMKTLVQELLVISIRMKFSSS
jgi:hypothetical protein